MLDAVGGVFFCIFSCARYRNLQLALLESQDDDTCAHRRENNIGALCGACDAVFFGVFFNNFM